MSDRRVLIGGNDPPLADRLDISYGALAQRVYDILAMEALPPISSDEDLPLYAERARILKTVAAMVEKSRKTEKQQILDDGRMVDDFFKKMAAPVTVAAEAVVSAVNAHQRKMLEERRAAEEAARKEAEARAAAEATPFDDPDPTPALAIPLRTAEATRVVSASGRVTATASTVWRHEVIDPGAVPRRFLVVNDAAIKAAIAGGVREIPGVRIHEELKTIVR